jgi:ribonuclease P protein component
LEKSKTLTFPKSARLLKSCDFQLQDPKRVQTPYFRVLYTEQGKGRLGISVSKRVLKNAVQRNRIKRLVREGFRLGREDFMGKDVVVIGLAPLTKAWHELKLEDVRKVFSRVQHVS